MQNSPFAKQSQYNFKHSDFVQLQGFLGRLVDSDGIMPLNGSLACVWMPDVPVKLELLAIDTYEDCCNWWQVSEVGLDLRQWCGRHDEPLLWLAGSYNL